MSQASRSWDREYLCGRYRNEPPVPFTDDIVSACNRVGITSGLYIGCGNGRNYVPLVEQGLDLVGLDISRVAIEQLRERIPHRRHRLVVGDLTTLVPDHTFGVVIGIQVFQHGDRRTAHRHIAAAQGRVEPGGLIAIRVNATITDIVRRHEVIEKAEDGGFTIRYLEGPKSGVEIHFFSATELDCLLVAEFESVLPLQSQTTARRAPDAGSWSQWEGIWRRKGTRFA